jgi:ATP/maltotriose-dependent transcriptional regulator MalT
MNHFAKHRYAQPLAGGQAFLLTRPIARPGPLVGSDRHYREIVPLPANGQQLMRWIEGLPRETLDAHPRLGLLYIHALLLTQQYERAQRYLKLTSYALRYWESSEKASIEAELDILSAYLRMHQELATRSREILNGLAQMQFPVAVDTSHEFTTYPSHVDGCSLPSADPLSKRELEVLHCLAAGMSNQEIAQKIVVAVGTVKRHINNIYNKLDVHSRIQAVRYAQQHHLLPV